MVRSKNRNAALTHLGFGIEVNQMSVEKLIEHDSAGFVIWLTGLPASGKTTLARALEVLLSQAGLASEVLDGDEIRCGLSADLGFSREDRQEHNRRVIFLSKLLIRNGITVVVPLISPYRKVRKFAREELGYFMEVWVRCSLEECIRRDPKGLYARALQGKIKDLTGLQDPYEEPLDPDVIVDTERESLNACVEKILLRLAVMAGAKVRNRLHEPPAVRHIAGGCTSRRLQSASAKVDQLDCTRIS